MNKLLLVPLPSLAVLSLVIAAALPLSGLGAGIGDDLAEDLASRLPGLAISGPEGISMALALLPVGAIYFWSVHRPQLMPAVAAFGCGLVLDVTTQGPLGVWSAAALVAALAGRRAGVKRRDTSWPKRTVSVVLTLAITAVLVSTIMALYFWDIMALRPMVLAVPLACAVYPVLAGALMLLDRLWPLALTRSLFVRGD